VSRRQLDAADPVPSSAQMASPFSPDAWSSRSPPCLPSSSSSAPTWPATNSASSPDPATTLPEAETKPAR